MGLSPTAKGNLTKSTDITSSVSCLERFHIWFHSPGYFSKDLAIFLNFLNPFFCNSCHVFGGGDSVDELSDELDGDMDGVLDGPAILRSCVKCAPLPASDLLDVLATCALFPLPLDPLGGDSVLGGGPGELSSVKYW